MKKVLATILALVLVASSFSACGAPSTTSTPPSLSTQEPAPTSSKPDEPVKLTFWTLWDGPDGAFAKEMVDEFAKEKGIELDMVVFSASQYYTKLKTSAISNDGPDIAVSHVAGYIPEFQRDGILMSLTQACKDYGVDINFNDYVSDVADAAKVDGEQYALPVDSIARLVYYNKSLLKGTSLIDEQGKLTLQPGINEFKSFMDNVKKEVPGVIAPMAFSPQAPQFVLNWLAFYSQKSTAPFFDTATSQVTFDDAAATAALSDYADIYNTYCPPNLSGNAHLDLFNNGQIPILIDGTFNMSSCEKALGDDLGIAYYPQWYDRPTVVSGSHSLMLMKKDGRSDEASKIALEFIKWFGDNNWKWAKCGALPANIKTYSQKEFIELPGRSELLAATKSSLPLPMLPVGMIHQTAEVKDPIEKAMRKEIAADVAIKQVKEGCQKIFDDNR